MTLTELNALSPLVEAYTAKGWEFLQTRTLETDDGKPVDHGYAVLSPRLIHRATIMYPFDERQLLDFEALSVARQNHQVAINNALYSVREDMLKEVAALYAMAPSKGASVPEYVVVKELRIPLFEQPSP